MGGQPCSLPMYTNTQTVWVKWLMGGDWRNKQGWKRAWGEAWRLGLKGTCLAGPVGPEQVAEQLEQWLEGANSARLCAIHCRTGRIRAGRSGRRRTGGLRSSGARVYRVKSSRRTGCLAFKQLQNPFGWAKRSGTWTFRPCFHVILRSKGELQERSEPAKEATAEYWTAAQERLFGHMKRLPKPWIRVTSSGGSVYYYNPKTGVSTFDEP